jgi:hypothetical protein
MKLGYAVLMTACLLLSTSVVAETGQESLPEDELGPEIWVDGPDAVLDGGGPNGPHVAIDEFGTRVHVWEVLVRRAGIETMSTCAVSTLLGVPWRIPSWSTP